jgi:hypothetical protein
VAAAELPDRFARLVPGILFVLWMAALVFALRGLIPSVSWLGRLLLASGVVVATIQFAPSPFMSFYFMTASVGYVAPLILGTAFVGLAASRRAPGLPRAFAAGLLAFIAGGFSETYTPAQLVAIAIALAVAFWGPSPAWRNARRPLIAGVVGSLVATGLLSAAPGNAVRYAAMTRLIGPRPSLLQLPGATAHDALLFFRDVFVANWSLAAALVVLGALVAATSPARPAADMRRASISLVLLMLAVSLVIVASLVPAALIEAGLTTPYAQVVPTYVGVCGVAAIGWATGRYAGLLFDRYRGHHSGRLPRRAITACAALVACGLAIEPAVAHAFAVWQNRGTLHAYAATKDLQAELARTAAAKGQSSATVPSVARLGDLGFFNHPIQWELAADPAYWINGDEAEFYGVGSISAPP